MHFLTVYKLYYTRCSRSLLHLVHIQVVGVRFSTGRGRRKEPGKKLGPTYMNSIISGGG